MSDRLKATAVSVALAVALALLVAALVLWPAATLLATAVFTTGAALGAVVVWRHYEGERMALGAAAHLLDEDMRTETGMDLAHLGGPITGDQPTIGEAVRRSRGGDAPRRMRGFA